jgi:hypothetical protein
MKLFITDIEELLAVPHCMLLFSEKLQLSRKQKITDTIQKKVYFCASFQDDWKYV